MTLICVTSSPLWPLVQPHVSLFPPSLHLSLPVPRFPQAWSVCPWQTWIGRPGKTTPWSSRLRTWEASWGVWLVPPPSTSRSPTSTTTRPCLTRVRDGRRRLLAALTFSLLCSLLCLNPHHLPLILPDNLRDEEEEQFPKFGKVFLNSREKKSAARGVKTLLWWIKFNNTKICPSA